MSLNSLAPGCGNLKCVTKFSNGYLEIILVKLPLCERTWLEQMITVNYTVSLCPTLNKVFLLLLTLTNFAIQILDQLENSKHQSCTCIFVTLQDFNICNTEIPHPLTPNMRCFHYMAIYHSDPHHNWFRQWLVTYSAPSQFQNKRRFIIIWTLRNKHHWNLNHNTNIFFKVEYAIYHKWPTLIRSQCITPSAAEYASRPSFNTMIADAMAPCVITSHGIDYVGYMPSNL